MFEAVRFVLWGDGDLHPRALLERQEFVQLYHIASHCAFASDGRHLSLPLHPVAYPYGDCPSRQQL